MFLGNSKHWEDDNGLDNIFLIWIGVEISDHQETYDGSYHDLKMSAYIADTIVTVSQTITIQRNMTAEERMTEGRPIIDYSLAMVDSTDTIYQKK